MSTRTEYDKIDALNWSRGKAFLRSPFHFKNAPEEPKETDAMLVGRMVHAWVLEGKQIEDIFAIKTKAIDFRTNIGKAWRDAQTKPILYEEDRTRIQGMAWAIAADPYAVKYIERCTLREHAIVEEMAGIKCKGLLDAVGNDADGRPGFFELKTTKSGEEDFWAKRCVTAPFHYDGQAEWYSMLMSISHDLNGERPWSVWITVESEPPHAVTMWAPDDSMVASGIDKVSKVLSSYKECQESGIWPAYHTGIEHISAPIWRQKQLEEYQ